MTCTMLIFIEIPLKYSESAAITTVIYRQEYKIRNSKTNINKRMMQNTICLRICIIKSKITSMK